MRSTTLFAALAVAASVVLVPAGAGAVDEPTQGTLLTTRPQQGASPMAPDSATPDYVAYVYGQAGSAQGSSLTIRRTSDGSLVREEPIPAEDFYPLPGGHLRGHSFVWTLRDLSTNARGGFEFHDVETGAKTGYIAPANGGALAIGEDWVLRTESSAVHLVRTDGSDITLGAPADMSLASGRLLAEDADSVFLDAGGDLAEIDLHTATVTRWLRGMQQPAHATLSGNRLVWDGWQTINDAWQFRVSWLDRRDGSTGFFPATPPTGDGAYLPLGDGYVARDGTALRPLDTSTGELGAPALTDVMGALPLGDGRVVASVNDDSTGQIALLDTGGAHTLTTLPQLLLRANTVLRSGDLVAATWQETAADPAPADLRFNSATAPGAWTLSPDGSDGTAVPAPSVSPAQMLTLAGDVALTQMPSWGGSMPFQVTWAGGSRQVTTGRAILGHGGQTLLVDQGDFLVGEDPHTGIELGRIPAAGGVPIAVDGTWVWRGPQFSPGFQLVGTDLVTGATRTASASAFKCAGRTVDFQVRGRWALLVCYDPYPSYGWAVTAMAVDLGGQYPAWNIPLGELGQIPALGARFVAWQSVDPVTGRRALMVADLAPEHETHTYGPMSWVWRVGVDDADVARLVYLDEQEQPRALEIPWLHPLAPGEVRPALQGAAVRAATGTTTELTVSWQGPWADGPLRYDVRWSSDGTWVQPLEWQALDANSVTLSVGPDTQTCFSVRARSDTGTPGPWSTATCGKVDGSAPVVAFTSTARVLLDNRPDVPIAYIAKDSVSGVASYDGQYRIAHPGQAYGSWVAPAAWQRSTASTQVLHLGPGDAGCVNVRAADVVGHTSGWVSRCLTRPIDDRQLTIDGKVVRSKSGLAYAGTYTRLSAKGASASLANQTGHQIALVVLRGPSQGTVHVYIGKHRVGRVHLTARTLQRALVWLPREASTWRGTVRLVSVSSAPARIDGIVIAR